MTSRKLLSKGAAILCNRICIRKEPYARLLPFSHAMVFYERQITVRLAPLPPSKTAAPAKPKS